MSSDAKQIGYFLERTTRIVKLAFHQAITELGIDVTPEQWVILERLYQDNGQAQIDLANKSFKNAPTISRILDLLSNKGYVERQRFENDRRRYKIYLTEEGHRIVELIKPEANRLRKQGWEQLSEEDYENFIRILNRVFSNFESN
jgi:DNA-binding MarR family transcriptional regulator